MSVPNRQVHLDRRILTLLLLGFSAGLPLMLIFSTLSLWLSEAGVERQTVTLFSWAALAYSFKFIWAPLTDVLSLPALSHLGQRRSWLLVSQLLVAVAMLWMGASDPAQGSLVQMAAAAVLLGFASATQDITIDAYRIESAPNDNAMQSAMSAAYTAGYRVGMIASGALALFWAEYWGSTAKHYVYAAWQKTYLVMAALMLIGIATTLFAREPQTHRTHTQADTAGRLRLLLVFIVAVCAFVATFRWSGEWLKDVLYQPLANWFDALYHWFDALYQSVLANFNWFEDDNRPPEGQNPNSPIAALLTESVRLMLSAAAAGLTAQLLVWVKCVQGAVLHQAWVEPMSDFFQRYGRRALLLLALIGLYRISDIVAGVVSNLFYADLGFSKTEIAAAVKTFGVLMSVYGGFVGGLLAQRIALMRLMMFGAIAAAATNILFALMAQIGKDPLFLYAAVGLDNFAAGLAGTVFVAFLSALTNIRFTAVQYALFSSLMTLLPKTLGGYSGAMVANLGYPMFFLLTAAMGLPVLLLVYWAGRHFQLDVPR